MDSWPRPLSVWSLKVLPMSVGFLRGLQFPPHIPKMCTCAHTVAVRVSGLGVFVSGPGLEGRLVPGWCPPTAP